MCAERRSTCLASACATPRCLRTAPAGVKQLAEWRWARKTHQRARPCPPSQQTGLCPPRPESERAHSCRGLDALTVVRHGLLRELRVQRERAAEGRPVQLPRIIHQPVAARHNWPRTDQSACVGWKNHGMRTGERAAVRLDIEDVDELLDEPSAWMRPAFCRRRVAMPGAARSRRQISSVSQGERNEGRRHQYV